jgi:hypothetical protein
MTKSQHMWDVHQADNLHIAECVAAIEKVADVFGLARRIAQSPKVREQSCSLVFTPKAVEKINDAGLASYIPSIIKETSLGTRRKLLENSNLVSALCEAGLGGSVVDLIQDFKDLEVSRKILTAPGISYTLSQFGQAARVTEMLGRPEEPWRVEPKRAFTKPNFVWVSGQKVAGIVPPPAP